MSQDPFGTAQLRQRVLAAWADSPSRRRADANLESDYADVGYRDRVVVELAQNAADAATRAGADGVLRLSLTDGVLRAANTGHPLDTAGVESIAVARASAKTGQPTVGRFGVGFAAVLSVSEEPSVRSTSGAVRWSLQDASSLVGPGPLAVLRLPFADDGQPPVGVDTEVVLPLRDGVAEAEVRRQLAELDLTILLALPALREVRIETDGGSRTLARDGEVGDRVVLRDGDRMVRWAIGRTPVAALGMSSSTSDVVWAVPVDGRDEIVTMPAGIRRAVRAPTPSDDPLTVGAVLIAPYPLDATRRRVTTGPDADAVTATAAQCLVDLMTTLPARPSLAGLVPLGFPDGELDAALHAAILTACRETAWIPVAMEPELRQRPVDAVVVADPLVAPLAPVVPSMVPAGWPADVLTRLGASRPAVAELVEALAGAEAEPGWWHDVYAGFDAAVGPGIERDALGALPVPLVDGSLVTGPRGVTVPSLDDAASGQLPDLRPLGVRVVDPDAAHPLLVALGAVEADPRRLLELPAVMAAVAASYDADDPGAVMTACLGLVAVTGLAPGALPWLADLALPEAGGEWRPAGELLLPGGSMARWVAPDSGFGLLADDVVAQWGTEVVTAAGVVDDPVVLRDDDVVAPDHDLDGEPDWWAGLPDGSALPELVAVRDLEQLDERCWPEVLAALAAPRLRWTVVEPAMATTADGARLELASYTAWWLSSHPVLDGRRPTELRLPGADPALRGLYDEVATSLDDGFLGAIGVRDRLDDLDAEHLLDRLADPARDVDRAALRDIYRAVAGAEVTVPEQVRALVDGEPRVVDASSAVVVDAPDLLPLLGSRPIIAVAASQAAALADTLDVDLASELGAGEVVSTGTVTGSVAGTVIRDATVHDRLLVTDVDGTAVEVPWRYVGATLHVDAREIAFGLGRGRAWRDGDWSSRHRRTEELATPAAGRARRDENDLDER